MKITSSLALLATVGLIASNAQAQQSYVGVNLGQTQQKLDVSRVGSLEEEETAVKLYSGYRYTDQLGIEAGYVHHGEAKVEGAASRPQSLYLAATASVPLATQFSLFGKLGVSYNRTKLSARGFGSDHENKATPLVGFGAAYAFTPSISGVVEFEHFGKLIDEGGVNLKARLWSIGVRATF